MRVKFLKRPGYDLDQIALRHAFNLKFSPARDKHGYPARSYIVWPLEWPAMGWLQENQLLATRLPSFPESSPPPLSSMSRRPSGIQFTGYPPCATGPVGFNGIAGSSGYHGRRDCSVPDISRANAAEPWIARDESMGGIDPIVDIDPRKELRDEIATARRNRIAAYATSGTAVMFLAGAMVAWVEYDKWGRRVEADRAPHDTLLPPDQVGTDERHDHNWAAAGFGLGTAAMLSGLASAYFWSHSKLDVSLRTSGESSALMLGGRF
jgi:hypothetical protein